MKTTHSPENVAGRYGNAEQFASEFDLDAEYIAQRDALYWAINALNTISFADRYKNTRTASWLRENVSDRIVK